MDSLEVAQVIVMTRTLKESDRLVRVAEVAAVCASHIPVDVPEPRRTDALDYIFDTIADLVASSRSLSGIHIEIDSLKAFTLGVCTVHIGKISTRYAQLYEDPCLYRLPISFLLAHEFGNSVAVAVAPRQVSDGSLVLPSGMNLLIGTDSEDDVVLET